MWWLQKNPLITLDKLRTLIIFLLLLLSCDFNYESNDNIVARAGEKTMTNEELIEKLPKIINSQGRQMNIFFACLGEALIPVN